MVAGATKAGEAFYKLTVDDKDLRSGLDRTLSIASRAARGIALAFSAAATKSITDFATKMDVAAKAAQKLGLPIEEFSKLEFAAQQTGVSSRTLEIGLQRLTRRIGEAKRGSKETAKVFKELGLNVDDLVGMSPDKQFKAFADSIKNVATQSERVAIVAKILDSEGVDLIRTMEGGAAAIDAFGREAEELGGVKTAEQARNAAELADSWGRVSTAMSGVSREFANALSPVISQWLDDSAQVLVNIRGWVVELKTITVLMQRDRAEQLRATAEWLKLLQGIEPVAGLLPSFMGPGLLTRGQPLSEIIRDLEMQANRLEMRGVNNGTDPNADLSDSGSSISVQRSFSARSGFGVAARGDVFDIAPRQIMLMEENNRLAENANELLEEAKNLLKENRAPRFNNK